MNSIVPATPIAPAADGPLARAARHNLPRMMAQAGITRTQLCDGAHITSGMVSFLLNGQRAGSLKMYERLASVLGAKPHMIFSPPSDEPCTNCHGIPRAGWICASCNGSQPADTAPMLRTA